MENNHHLHLQLVLIKTLIPNVSHRSGLGGTGRSCMNDDAGIDANPGAYQSLVPVV